MSDKQPTPTEHAYGNLLNEFRRAHSSGEKAKADRIDVAITLFEELWPEDCKRWRERFGG
jgi:hypothetical protein